MGWDGVRSRLRPPWLLSCFTKQFWCRHVFVHLGTRAAFLCSLMTKRTHYFRSKLCYATYSEKFVLRDVFQ